MPSFSNDQYVSLCEYPPLTHHIMDTYVKENPDIVPFYPRVININLKKEHFLQICNIIIMQ